jgi:dihydrodipicolinate synthase/N-acetylneuraminate lyase
MPWTDSDELDEQRYRTEINSYKGTGVHGLYTGGTTGEFYAQDDETFEQVSQITCEESHAIGLPVQIGVTALSTRTVLQRIRVARTMGADGVQVALPFWLQLQDDEAVGFFRAVQEAAGDTPFTYYQTSRAKRKLPPALIGQLARELPGFIGMKETGCSPDELKAILREAPDLAIFGGDNDLWEKMQAGGTGSYSAVVGLNPRVMVDLYETCAAGNWDRGKKLQDGVTRMLNECLIPIAIEAGLEDSAIDRIQRVAGGGDVGLGCQRPYRSGTPQQVERLIQWCNIHALNLLTG